MTSCASWKPVGRFGKSALAVVCLILLTAAVSWGQGGEPDPPAEPGIGPSWEQINSCASNLMNSPLGSQAPGLGESLWAYSWMRMNYHETMKDAFDEHDAAMQEAGVHAGQVALLGTAAVASVGGLVVAGELAVEAALVERTITATLVALPGIMSFLQNSNNTAGFAGEAFASVMDAISQFADSCSVDEDDDGTGSGSQRGGGQPGGHRGGAFGPPTAGRPTIPLPGILPPEGEVTTDGTLVGVVPPTCNPATGEGC